MLFVLQLLKMRYSFIQENRDKYALRKCRSCKRLRCNTLCLKQNTILLLARSNNTSQQKHTNITKVGEYKVMIQIELPSVRRSIISVVCLMMRTAMIFLPLHPCARLWGYQCIQVEQNHHINPQLQVQAKYISSVNENKLRKTLEIIISCHAKFKPNKHMHAKVKYYKESTHQVAVHTKSLFQQQQILPVSSSKNSCSTKFKDFLL